MAILFYNYNSWYFLQWVLLSSDFNFYFRRIQSLHVKNGSKSGQDRYAKNIIYFLFYYSVRNTNLQRWLAKYSLLVSCLTLYKVRLARSRRRSEAQQNIFCLCPVESSHLSTHSLKYCQQFRNFNQDESIFLSFFHTKIKVVICASQIFWTSEVHEAIRAGPHGLPEYQEKLTKQVSFSRE